MLTPATRVSLKNNMRVKGARHRSHTLCESIYTEHLEEAEPSMGREQTGLPGLEEAGVGSDCSWDGISFGGMGMFRNWTEVVVAQLCECANCHCTVHLQMHKKGKFYVMCTLQQ